MHTGAPTDRFPGDDRTIKFIDFKYRNLRGGGRAKVQIWVKWFGADFSSVRVHVDCAAAGAGALAFTRGDDIHFAPGQYDPESTSGQELIGHELAHVVQQREGRVETTGQAAGLLVNDDRGLEREADEQGARRCWSIRCRGSAGSRPTTATSSS